MWEKYKQKWKINVRKEIGDRTAIQALLFYGCIFFGNLGILFIGLFALIFAGFLSVSFHVLPAQDVVEILGIIFIGWLYFMLAFYCTKTGNKFIADMGKKIEKSVNDTLQGLRVFPILPSLQVVKFIHSNEAADSFIPTPPFTPPRRIA